MSVVSCADIFSHLHGVEGATRSVLIQCSAGQLKDGRASCCGRTSLPQLPGEEQGAAAAGNAFVHGLLTGSALYQGGVNSALHLCFQVSDKEGEGVTNASHVKSEESSDVPSQV